MKIAPKSIADFLRQPEKNTCGVLLYGPDEGLARTRATGLRTALNAQDTIELSDARLREDPAQLADALASSSLFGGRSIVLLRDASDKLVPVIEAALQERGNYLIALTGELTPRSALRKLFEDHARLAALPCYHDEAADISALIRTTLNGIRLQPGVAEYLARVLGNDRAVTLSELEKIRLYAGDAQALSLEEAQALCADQKEAQFDLLSFAVTARAHAPMERQLGQFLREGISPVALLRAVQRHVQRVYQARAAMDSGMAVAQAVAQLKPPVFFRQVPTMTEAVARWSQPQLASALLTLARAEAACKSGAMPQMLVCARGLAEVAQL